MERHPYSRLIEYSLFMKMLRYRRVLRGLRKNSVFDVFDRLKYIGPEDVRVTGFVRKKPAALFNPGAVLRGRKLVVFPRIVFGYYHYSSVIGVFEIDVEELLGGKNTSSIDVKIIVYPTEPWEQALGCEDPRVTYEDGRYIMLYTAVDYTRENVGLRPCAGLTKLYSLQALAILDNNFNIVEKKYFRIKGLGRYHVPLVWKDSAFIGEGVKRVMLTRPRVLEKEVAGWKTVADLSTAEAYLDQFKPILYTESWEKKIGWSTNVVEVSPGEYLIGWHGVSVIDGMYRNGFMLLDREGNPLMISRYYLLAPKNINELYGDRPGVIFGNALIKYGELLIWIGGVADHAIGFYVTEINKVMEHMRDLKLE